MRTYLTMLALIISTSALGQQIFRMPAVCYPSTQVHQQVEQGNFRLIFEITKSYREGVIKTSVYRDSDGDYIILEEMANGLTCMLSVGKESRIGPALG